MHLKSLILVLTVLAVSCQEKNASPFPFLSEAEKARRASVIIDTVINNLKKGTWKIKRVEIKVTSNNNNTLRELGIYRDTVLTDFAELRFLRVTYRTIPQSEQYRNCWLAFVYKNQAFDMELPLYAIPESSLEGNPIAFFVPEVRPQNSPSSWPQNKDLDFINKLGFTDNFLLSFENKQMIWRGLNQGLPKVVFERK